MKNILLKSTFLILMMVSRGIQAAELSSSDNLTNEALAQLVKKLTIRVEDLVAARAKDQQAIEALEKKFEIFNQEFNQQKEELNKQTFIIDRITAGLEDKEEKGGMAAKPPKPDGLNEGIKYLTTPFTPGPTQPYFSLK